MQRTKTIENTATQMTIGGPAIVVLLFILLGATFYLWRARYMRSRTAYITMAVLFVLLLGACYVIKTQG